MKKNLSRRDVLKMIGAGAAGIAATPVLNVAGAPSRVRKVALLQQTTEITFWTPPMWRYAADNTTVVGTGSSDYIDDAIRRFEADHLDIKVNMELVPWDQWGTKTATGFAGGDLPNVIYNMLSPDRIEAGLFAPLNDYLTQDMLDNWLPGVADPLTVNGNIYAIPAFLNPDMAALSVSALQAHGGDGILTDVGDDRGDLTFDKMQSYGAQFSDGSTRYFLGIPTDHGSIAYWGFGTWLNGWGVRVWNEDESQWIANQNPDAIKAMQWYLDAQNDWKIMIPNLPKWSDVDTFYWGQNAAMRFQWPGIQTELEVAQSAGQAADDFTIMLTGHPHTPEQGKFQPNLQANNFGVTQTDDANKLDAAFVFANWLATDDSNATSWLVNGIFPATKSGSEAVKDNPAMADPNRKWVLTEYLPNYPQGFPGWNFQPTKNARSARAFAQLDPYNYHIQEFQSMLLGQKTPEQMLEEMAQRINGAIASA